MLNKFIKFLLLYSLFCSSNTNAEDDANDRFSCEPTKQVKDYWISQMIKEKEYFEAKIEVVDLQTEQTTISLVDEVYDFGNDAGETKFEHCFTNEEECVIEYAKYFKDPSVVYTSSNETYKCKKGSISDKDLVEKFMHRWLPEEILKDGFSVAYSTMLGPSSMLLHLREKIQDDKIHEYSFEDEDLIMKYVYNLCIGDRFMIKFFQVQESSLESNLLQAIQIWENKTAENVISIQNDQPPWTLRTQFNYYFVDIRNDIHLDKNLPLGLGCEREATDFKKPQINDQKFEIDLQFISNQGNSYKEHNINHFDPRFSKIEHHKIYFDQAQDLAVDFQENANVTKQVHDYSIQIMYDIDLSTGICQKILTDQKITSKEFDNPLSIIKRIPEVLTLTEKSNYIGTFLTRNIMCEVFEGTLQAIIDGENENFIVTHYYSSLNFDWASPDKLPLRIDLRRFSSDEFDTQLGYYVFMINKFYPGLDFGRQEIFDISYCMPHYYEYNWFLITFTCDRKQIETLKSAQLALAERFKKELGISSLRVPKILIDYDDTTVYITTKLLEVPAINEHFKRTTNQKLRNYREFYLADHEQSCAKSCFSKADCVAFSYCTDMRCAQLMLENYSNSNTTIPIDYIKSDEDDNCILQERKFKLKRDDISSRDIRSVMSILDRKVNSGKFHFDIKIKKADNEEMINLTATEIVLNVEPGSRQSDYQEDEEWSRGTSEKYEQFFNIVSIDYSFDYEKMQNKDQLITKQTNLGLADCELQCMNELNCHSFAYCTKGVCILTSASGTEAINENKKFDIDCFISKKNYLSNYAVHENRGIKNRARKKVVLEKIEDETPETCALLCSTSNEDEKDGFECLSFEYCDAKKKAGSSVEKVCLLHELNLQSEHEQKLEWNFEETQCDHYTKKHSTDYREYSMQQLIKNDLIEHTKIPLEKCARICDEHEVCNSFDYCFEQDEHNVFQSKNLRCRLHTDVYNEKNIELNSTYCSVYETIRPKIPVKKIIIKQTTYSKGLTVALSFVALISGSSIGVLLSFFVIRKFFHDNEEDS